MTQILTLDQTKAVYRAAIDPRASDGEGDTWWREVQSEMAEVLTATTLPEAAAVIAWWHADWRAVGDSASAAARRLRTAARRLGK